MTRGSLVVLGVALLVGGFLCRGAWAQGPQLKAGQESVPRYGRAEFTIDLDREYGNPYDPEEVRLSLEVRTPSGELHTVPAFYYQDYEHRIPEENARGNVWQYPVGEPVWKARYAPAETGEHRCVAVLEDRQGTMRSGEVRFSCTPSERGGYVRVSDVDPRFLQLSDGKPFFPVGHNVAFMCVNQHVGLHNVDDVFRRMAANGANYTRLWTGCHDWAIGIEALKSAWTRSWTRDDPRVPMPGTESEDAPKCVRISGEAGKTVRSNPSHKVGLRPGVRYVLSATLSSADGARVEIATGREPLHEEPLAVPAGRWTSFRATFTQPGGSRWLSAPVLRLKTPGTVYLKQLSLREAGGGPDLLWEADPNEPIMGHYNQVDCFLLDKVLEAAERHGIRIQFCLFTRDRYMGLLRDPESAEYAEAIRYGKNLLRYSVGRWGYSTSMASWEYFNELNPGLPTNHFYRELGQYLEEIDPYGHPRATSAWHDSPRDWQHPQLDIPQMHWYLRPDKEDNYVYEVDAILARCRNLLENSTGKPAMMGECGLATRKWGISELMKQDEDLIHFHNMLWATSLSGLCGTGMLWWWEELDTRDAYHHYRPLAAFLPDDPFARAHLAPVEIEVSDERVRPVALGGEGYAAFWLQNREASWKHLVVEGREPTSVAGLRVQLPGLDPGRYRVEWWDTWQGRVTGSEEVRADGDLTLEVPAFTRDIACRIARR